MTSISIASFEWDIAASWFDNHIKEYGDGLNFDYIDPTLYELLGDQTEKDILDAGCGNGYETVKLAKSRSFYHRSRRLRKIGSHMQRQIHIAQEHFLSIWRRG
jgi:hypothetical protein